MKKEDKYNDFLFEMRQTFAQAEDYYTINRVEQLEDYDFNSGNQWDSRVRQERVSDSRPVLEVDYISVFVDQIINNYKKNRPSVNVKPMDYYATTKVADVLTLIIKDIEKNSDAEIAYDCAFRQCVIAGEGYFRVITDYLNEKSFDQDILIRKINNPFSVYIDPRYHEDNVMDYAFIFSNISKKEFFKLYPDANCTSANWDYYVSNYDNSWYQSDKVRICEYFYKEYKDKEIYLLSDGQQVTKEEYEDMLTSLENIDKNNLLLEDNPELELMYSEEVNLQSKSLSIVSKKKIQETVIKWCKTNGYEILEETEWMGKYIPIIPVLGNRQFLNGRYNFQGILRKLKTTQKMINLCESTEAELLANSPISPFMGPKEVFQGYERKWNVVTRRPLPYIEYNSGEGGKPERLNSTSDISTIQSSKLQHIESLKLLTGIQDPALGINSQVEQSGIAILTNKRQSELSNYHFSDNFCQSLKLLGKILIDLIPKVYDSSRIVRDFSKPFAKDRLISLNGNIEEDSEVEISDTIDLLNEKGLYSVDVSIGPYGESQRQQAVQTILTLSQTNPDLFNIMGDLMLQNMDWAGADEAAERFKKMLPPQLQSNDNQISPEIQAQLDQAQQQIEIERQQSQQQIAQFTELTSNMLSKMNDLATKLNNKQLDIESKERIALQKNNVDLMKEQMKQDLEFAKIESQKQIRENDERINQLDVKTNQEEDIPGEPFVLPGFNDPTMINEDDEEDALDSIMEKINSVNGDVPGLQENIGNSVLRNNASNLT